MTHDIPVRSTTDTQPVQVPVTSACHACGYIPGQTINYSIPEALETITKAVRNDPDYAWGWYCNLTMAYYDEGGDHLKSNKAAARFMDLLFDHDMMQDKRYRAIVTTAKPTLWDRFKRWWNYLGWPEEEG